MQDASRSVDEQARAALSATKRLHQELREVKEARELPPDEAIDAWRRTLAGANRAISLLMRMLHTQRQQHNVETSVILEELRSELVDREAHAARTSERFRLFIDRDAACGADVASVSSSAYERAIASARQLETSIALLSCSAHEPGAGTRALSE